MFWDPSKRKGACCALAALLLAAPAAAAADILVVRSLGPSAKSFPPGKRLAETARITLKAQDQLVVLDGRGTRTIRGPGSFVAGTPAVRTASAAPVQQRRARIGAVRGPGDGEVRPPSIWHVDVAKSSNICVADGAGVTLWRAAAADPVTLTIAAADGTSRTVEWEGGASTVSWPEGLSTSDGAKYRLSWDGSAEPTVLTFKALPKRPAGLEDMASSLITSGCEAQLDLLIETVRLPDDAPPSG